MRAVLCVAMLACCTLAPAWAQTITAEPTAAQRCLTSAPGQPGVPEYPFDELKRKVKGSVRVELVFTLPDKRPETIVLESNGGSAFVDAVKEHARHLRVPCLQAAEVPSRLRLDFVFQPDDRKVVGATPEQPEEVDRLSVLKCMVHNSGRKAPDFPTQALREGIGGRVVAEFVFDAPDKPPAVTVYARPYARVLARAVDEWAQGYRLPCMQGAPVTATVEYRYAVEGDGAYGMPDLTLLQFIKSVKDLEKLRLALDTTTMSCPFDLRMTYYAPMRRNVVGQLGNYNAARQPLLDWLHSATLNLPAADADAVFADTFTVHVPCIKFDLKPKE